MPGNNVTKTAYQNAVKVLKENIIEINGKHLFLACPHKCENYYSIWTRDAVYTMLACLDIGDELLNKASIDSFELIHSYQTELGRIPAYISLKNPSQPIAEFGGWGRIETLDSQLWFVIAAKEIFEKTNDEKYISPQYLASYRQALQFLNYRTLRAQPNNFVFWPVSSGWDDQMQRKHHVTSAESLRVIAIKTFIDLLKHTSQKDKIDVYKERVKSLSDSINESLWLTKDNIEYLMANDNEIKGPGYYSIEYKEIVKAVKKYPEKYQFYQSYLAPYEISSDHIKRFDTYGNLLAILAGIPNKNRIKIILNYIDNEKLNAPYPIRTLNKPIKKGDLDYNKFYETARNKPFSYQNGAIWPHITALYIKVLVENNQTKKAEHIFEKLCEMVLQEGTNKHSFSEYYRGDSGKPGKSANEHQCWSAASILFAKAAIEKS